MRAKTTWFTYSICFLFIFCIGCSFGPKEARFLAAGKRYLDRKNPARAIIEFKNAAQAAPASAEPEYQLGLAYIMAGDYTSGVGHLIKATDLNPNHAGAQTRLAELMSTSHNKEVLDQAAARARRALSISPNDPQALDAMAMAEWNLADPDAAEQHLQQALRDFPGHLKSAVMLANLKIAHKDLAGAETILKGAASQAPAAFEPLLALANFYTLINRPDDAETNFQEVLKRDSNNSQALLGLAALRVRAGKKQETEEIYSRISRLPDKQYRSAHALYQIFLGDRNQGISELETLWKADASDPFVRNRLIAAYLSERRLKDAELMLTRELKRNHKDMPSLLQRAQLYIAQTRYNEAEQDLNACLRLQPDMAEARFFLAIVYGGRGESLRERQELNEAVRLNSGLLKARLALAKLLMFESAYQSALDLLNQAPESQKSLLQVIAARNEAYIAMGNLKEARKGIEQGLKISRTSELLLQDATMNMRLKDMLRSKAILEEVLKREPSNAVALDMLMTAYVAEKNAAGGLERVRAIASAAPQSADVQLSAGNWLQSQGKLAEARQAYEAAKAADRYSGKADRLLLQLDLSTGKVDDARRRLASLSPETRSTPEVRTLSAMVEQQAGNYSGAIEQFRGAVLASPKSVVALNNLAYLLVDYANKPDEGLEYAQKVKELAPNDPIVDDTIGWAYYHKGLYPAAVAHLEKATARTQSSAIMRYHLAMAYLKAGQRQQAQKTLNVAMRLDPNLQEAKAAQQLWRQVSNP